MAEALPRIPEEKRWWIWRLRERVRRDFCRRCEYYRGNRCLLLESGMISVIEFVSMPGCRYFTPRKP